MSLKENLKEWTDLDIAMYFVAVELNILEANDFPENKWLFWTNNVFNDFLQNTITKMIELKILEAKQEENSVRFNQNFKVK